jgi:hypothetical protein
VNLFTCWAGSEQPDTASPEEMSERPMHDLWSLWFTSEVRANPALL